VEGEQAEMADIRDGGVHRKMYLMETPVLKWIWNGASKHELPELGASIL